jgi:tRNA G18 (ribose-2'-O)-methylase SpoU
MMGVVCLLGWVCHKLWELNETRVTSGASFDTVSLDLRKQVCKVVLRVDVHPKFIKPAYPQVEQPTGTPGMLPNAAQPSMQLWGQVVSTALCSLWNCYRFVLRQSRAVGERALGVSVNVPDVFAQLTDCMDSAQLDMNVVLDCLTSTVPEMLEHNSSRLLDFISKCWSLVLSLKDHHKELWIAVKSFVKFAFHPLLLMPSEELREEVQPLLTNLNDEIYELGESKSGYCNLLMEHCCEEWLEAARSSEDTAAKRLSSSLSDYMDVIISACMFGPVGKRSQKAVDDVEAHIAALEASCGTNQLKLMYRHGDSNVRVTVISFLFELIAQSQGIRPSSWITDVFLVQLMKTMVEKSLAMSRSKPRYYLNSLPHRQKTRLWQVILTLVLFINKDASAHLVPLLFESLDFDNQLSVKHMIEWVVTILLLRTPSLLPSLIDRLAYKEVKTRLACLPSFISIGCHLFTAVKNKEEQVSFCRQFLQVLLQWTQGQHVVSRLYAQAALLRTWDQMKETDCLAPVAEEFAVLDSVVEFSREYSDVVKFQHKLQSNVFFTLIDEYKDWNLETIFYCLPLLTSVIASEFVAVDEFLAVSSFWTKQDVLPLRCKRPEVLVKCKECESATGVAGDGEDEGDGEGDVQKKIVPWSGPEALHELFPNHVVVEGGRNDLEKSIILVSSLVNKPANLGGLSRTCEIFGVTELVIGNKNILEDALFQALSVTSERWLNITEVRVPELSGYLLAAKQQGYTLVGVEQTANSKCLTSYNFPRKTLLLLGNEREGIPVDLIHHLEECVEIPQLGLVRSLNVHVSGALMVWEFAKQHLIGQD